MDHHPTPTNGRGTRNPECAEYGACMDESLERGWFSGWNCEACPLYREPQATASACGTLHGCGETRAPACMLPGCTDKHRARGLCTRHYCEWQRGGLDHVLGPFFPAPGNPELRETEVVGQKGGREIRRPVVEKSGPPMCRDCGERPAMMNPNTRKPVNGRCGQCHSEIMREAVRKRQRPKAPAPENPKEDESVTEPKEKACERCGEVKGIEEFQRHTRAKSGRAGICKACLSVATSKGKNAVKAEQRGGVYLDLSQYPEVTKSLPEAAHRNIRSVEHQAIAYIVRGLQEDERAGEVA